MHWVYILRTEVEEGDNPKHDHKIYIGETTRLFRRLKEHCGDGGSITTYNYRPIRLLAIYKVKNDSLREGDPIVMDMYEKGYWDGNDKEWGCELENKLTLQYMKAMGRKWKQVYGGKWCRNSARYVPAEDCT